MLKSIVAVSFLFVVSLVCLNNSNVFAVDTDQIYADKCEMCHGPDGKGSQIGIDFGVHDFTDKGFQASKTDEEFINSITNGKEENPNYIPFGGMLTDEEIKAMAERVRKFAE